MDIEINIFAGNSVPHDITINVIITVEPIGRGIISNHYSIILGLSDSSLFR